MSTLAENIAKATATIYGEATSWCMDGVERRWFIKTYFDIFFGYFLN